MYKFTVLAVTLNIDVHLIVVTRARITTMYYVTLNRV